MSKVKVAVLYGSRSTEHEVSIITALQVLHNLNPERYDLTPIYITKSGEWIRGNHEFLKPELYSDLNKLLKKGKPIKPGDISADVVLPIMHGTYGEDGTIQGLLETLNLPYTGPGVMAAALAMDKCAQKQLFTAHNIPQVKYIWFYKSAWLNNPSTIMASLKKLKTPLYVKPANGGSSIGITKAKSFSELENAIEVACFYDTKIIVEESVENAKEINISILGNAGSDLIASVPEQPIASAEVLTFADKYQSNSKSAGMASAKRLIPAPIKPSTLTQLESLAKSAFVAIDGSGVARIDFLLTQDEKHLYLNEINTIPGSLAYYLWQPQGLHFPELLDKLIELAQEKYARKSDVIYTFANNLLTNLNQNLNNSKIKG